MNIHQHHQFIMFLDIDDDALLGFSLLRAQIHDGKLVLRYFS